MVKCTPIKVLQLFGWPMTPLIIGLPYDHPHPSGSQQFWLLDNGQQTCLSECDLMMNKLLHYGTALSEQENP